MNGVKKASAGTAVIDTPHLTKFIVGHDVTLPFCTKGRAQLRRYMPKDPSRDSFQVFNFYLVSGPDYVENTRIVKSLLTVDCSVPTFVGGDMNFVDDFSDTTSTNPSLPTRDSRNATGPVACGKFLRYFFLLTTKPSLFV